MALPGPAPKDNKVGRTPTADWTVVEDTPFSGGPSLPEREWHTETVRWWDLVSTMPHAALWTATDWIFATDTALLKDDFYLGKANSSDKVEMRRREDLMAVSSEARRKNRIRYVEPRPTEDAPAAGTVTPISSGRSRRRIVED